MIEIYIPTFLVRAWWFLNDRCDYCGGKVVPWSIKKAFCRDCGKRN